MQTTFPPYLAPTGRVKSYMEDPLKGTLPASCTTHFLKSGDLVSMRKMFYFVQKALVTAAGVNIHLDGFNPGAWPQETPGKLYNETPQNRHNPGAHYLVQDSMDWDQSVPGNISIMGVAGYVLTNLVAGQDVYLNLSNIRPQGTVSSKGQIASGPESFWEIFQAVEKLAHEKTISSLLAVLSTFNSVIRRGGVFKNGAVTTSLPIWSNHFTAYLEADPKTVHPWLKKGAVLPSDWDMWLVEIYHCIQQVNEGNLWLEKAISAKDSITWLTYRECMEGKVRLLHNVCREVLLKSNGTCILLPVNLGQIETPEMLIKAYKEGMEFLCKFQQADHQSRAKIYLSALEDRQVGLGLFGFANFLKIHGFTYEDFTKEFSRQMGYYVSQGVDGINLKLQDFKAKGYRDFPLTEGGIVMWVNALIQAFSEAATIANLYQMNRAFAIAPTANVSYRYRDLEGFSCAPEFSPPIGKEVERVSSTVEEVETFKYGDVEIASETGFDTYFNLANLFQQLMDSTGLGHAISFNLWEDIDFGFLKKWSQSSLKSTYYRLEVRQNYLDKSDQVCSLTDKNCGTCG